MASVLSRNIISIVKTAKVKPLALPFGFHQHLSKLFCTTINQDEPSATELIVHPSEPLIQDYKFKHLRTTTENPKQAWIESLSSIKEEKLGLVRLHPDIFSFVPRLDIIHENVLWQQKYKDINRRHAKLPCEMRGPGKGFGRKPWPQKGMGRARQGSTRAPQWVKGGTVHGPRRYTTKFFMLPFPKRLLGLISTLSCKFAQDDIKIVANLEVPSDEPAFIEDLIEERCWGPSVLFVDVEDIMPRNITLATDEILHLNLLPVYGLNVHSMLKHDTLVLTVAALERIEERLLYHLYRPDSSQISHKRYVH